MKKLVHKFEIFVDKSIPYLLGILLLVIIWEIFFHEFMVKYHTAVQIIDWIIIAFFAIDLGFKYNRMRNFPKFLKSSWLEIIAIFPFFLVFRFFEGIIDILGIGETAIVQTQKVVHVSTEVEKEISVVSKEAEAITKEVSRYGSRSSRFARFLRPISRSIRFFELGDPKIREETEKDIKKAEKAGKLFIKGAEKVPKYVKTALFFEKAGVSYHKKENNK